MHLYCPKCSTNIYIENEVKAKKVNCPTCNREIDLDALRGLHGRRDPDPEKKAPPRTDTDSDPWTEPIAWELAGHWFTCLWLTCYQVLLRPWVVFKTPGEGGFKNPYVFGLIMYYPAVTPLIINYLLYSPWQAALYACITILIIGPAVTAALLFGIAGLQHGLLTLFKAKEAGFGETFRVTAYSMACWVLVLLIYLISLGVGLMAGPEAGLTFRRFVSILPFFWWLMIMILGLATAHMSDFARIFLLIFLEFALIMVVLLGVFSV